jgi:hypothetical protein
LKFMWGLFYFIQDALCCITYNAITIENWNKVMLLKWKRYQKCLGKIACCVMINWLQKLAWFDRYWT